MYKVFHYLLIIIVVITSKNAFSNDLNTIKKEELDKVGALIFKNEAASKISLLVHWNDGEDFPSLGIGHFIWYKKNSPYAFDETFPSLIKFYKQMNIKLPKILLENDYPPWQNKEELLASKNNTEVIELMNFLYETRSIQVLYMHHKLKMALEKILVASANKNHVMAQFNRVSNSKGGYYALIDYVNFKGDGTKASENYHGYSWGLLQVLENMHGEELNEVALNDFVKSAIMVLALRITYSNEERNEERWLRGWVKRVITYKEAY